ncbi:MAG: (2Fe-2S)-binding protein [Gammaproteobacteria bacterium]|nr:(2Fe-2S)-binding protein [Gammaproteobacteria bacterium]
MNLIVNGQSHTIDADPQTSLIFVLRNDLNLVGAKLGCGLEQCGSCVVLADGEPVYSCTRTVADLQGTNIETVEGLAQAEALHPVQQAFLEENAAQCGYCTSGIIMRVIALLRDNPDPSPEEVNAALDAHLCRCGAHPRILRAVATAARMLRSKR